MEICRVCLKFAEGQSFKKIIDIGIWEPEEISYWKMFNTVTLAQLNGDEILCSSCCSELLQCYKFQLKIEEAHKFFKAQQSDYASFACDTKEISSMHNFSDEFQYVKDPLEETDDDDNNSSDIEINTSAIAFSSGDCNKFADDLLNDVQRDTNPVDNSQDPCKEENETENVLLNDLSDVNISAETLIFPQGRLKCKICDRAYFTTTGLAVHQEVHLPKMPPVKRKRIRGPNKRKISNTTSIPNEDTNEIIAPTALKAVMLESHLNTSESLDKTLTKHKEKPLKAKKVFPCHVCGKHMISASKLRYHMVMHTGEKDFLCSMCPKAYSTIYALKHHFRTHTGDRPYECKFCGDRFTRPTTLKSHVRRHTGERPYGCEICGKRFIQHSSMATHIKLNHMDKTISCPHCDKKYARQTDLNTHILSHTGDKKFRCPLCSSRFIRQANLNKHMKHHSENSSKQVNSYRKKAKNAAKSEDMIHQLNENNGASLKPSNNENEIHYKVDQDDTCLPFSSSSDVLAN